MKTYLLIQGKRRKMRKVKLKTIPYVGHIITTKKDRDYEVTAIRHDYGGNKLIIACERV